ncbi:Rpa1ap [Castilleja foliolosa]|uniref:Rpa1ap n=1 Tax=Castilleja foliolosa TaxID=1961234 RepID=A0ABD3CAU2_9LAMI
MCARRVWRGEDGLMTCVHCGFVNHNAIYRYSLEVEFRDESGTAWLVLSHEASTRLIGQSVDDVMGVQGESVTRLPDWIVEDLEGREALFEVFKTPEEDVHVFDCPRLTIDEELLEQYEDKYPHGPPEEDWDNQSDITEMGENDEAVCRAPPVYVGEPSGVNDPDATQASKRRTE